MNMKRHETIKFNERRERRAARIFINNTYLMTITWLLAEQNVATKCL